MTDRNYPSSKPPANGTATTPTTNGTTAATNPSFPATKAQLYGATRPSYRPQPKRHGHRRSCCCSCCLWLTLTLILLILLAAVAGGILYALYRPHRPSFSVSSLKIQTLNLTSSSQTLITNINLTVNTRNPNKELVFYYDPITVSLTTGDDDISVGVGSFPSFRHGTKNTTVLKAAIRGRQELDDASAGKVKAQLKSNSGLPLKMKLETKVKVKMGAVKSPKVRIRVICEGIKATAPTGKTASLASTSNAKCKVDLRIKIWKWTF